MTARAGGGPVPQPMRSMPGARTAAGAWLSTIAANGLVVVCGIATGGLVARLLHADGRGVLASIVLWPQLLGDVGLLGVHEALTQRLSSRSDRSAETLWTGLVLSLVFAMAASVIGIALVPLMVGRDEPDVIALARWYIAVIVPINFFTLALYGFEHGQRRFGRYNAIRSTVPLSYLFVLLYLWAVGWSRIETVLSGNVLAAVIGLIVTVSVVRPPLPLLMSRSEAAALAKMTAHFSITSLLFVLSSQVDRIIVVKFWDDRSIGFYVVALTVSTTVSKALAHGFHTVIFPNIARYQTVDQQRDYLARGLRHVMLLTCVTSGVLIVASPVIMQLVFGEEFARATGIVTVLLLAQIPATLRQVTIRALRGIGEPTPGSIAEALTGGVFLLALSPLAAVAGLTGLAWATCVANCASAFYLSNYLRTRLSLRLRDLCGLDRRTVLEFMGFGRSLFVRT